MTSHFNHSFVAEYLGSQFLIITNAQRLFFYSLVKAFLRHTFPSPRFIIRQAGLLLTIDGILLLLSARWYLLC